MRLLKWTLLLLVATASYAADTSVKNYTLKDLKNVVAGDSECKTLHSALLSLGKKPVTLEFANNNNGEYDVKHQNNKLINHTYKVIQQTTTDTAVNRIGMGTFELDNNKMDYVLQVSVDSKHGNHQYAYPIIISNEKSHCVFTGLLKPDQKTLTAFMRNIREGKLENGKDLTSQ